MGAFVLNGLVLASGEQPRSGVTAHPAAAPPGAGERIRVLSYNVAKAFVHRGGLSFAEPSEVRRRLDDVAEVIRRERPDLVALQEVVLECGPSPVNQVTYLAEATNVHFWAFGENYNLGFPLYRIAGGNAILCRWKLEPLDNPDLPGRKPFWVSTNNRRILWCATPLGGATVAVGVVHADSFALENGERQIAHILEETAGRPSILAGDFNAEPHDRSMRLVQSSRRFSGEIHGGAATFPAQAPARRIDFVLAPRSWEHVETRVVAAPASDHAAVVADFLIRE